MKIKKAVIPVAGKGTRMLPASKNVAKELMPIITTPIVHYVVQEALDAGIEQIVFITSIGKEDIISYFSRSIELENFLEKNGKYKELEQVKNIGNMIDIITVSQKEQLGLGHAILQAERVIGNDPFAVMLGDDVMMSQKSVITQLKEVSEANDNQSVIGVMQVEKQHTNKYGIIDGEYLPHSQQTLKIKKMVEKPSPETAPSLLASPGRYIFTAEIFDYLKSISRGVGGEYQLTDAINMMAQNKTILAHQFEGERFDTGNVLGYIDAIVAFALKDSVIGEQARAVLAKRLKN